MSDIRLKKITVEPSQSPLIIQNGDISITSTTNSTSVLDGAVVINGGMSINTTVNSTSSTSGGGLTVGGGVGIMKNVFIGNDLNLDSSNGIFKVNGLSESRLFLDNITNKAFHIAPDGVNKRLELTDTLLKVNITNPSTNSTTGAIWVNGGVSISSTVDSSSETNGGAITVAGGGSFAKTLNVGQRVILGEHSSNTSGMTIRYTGTDQIVLQDSGSAYGSINMNTNKLIIGNPNDVVLQTSTGNIDVVNNNTKMISVHSDNTEFLENLFISKTTASTSSSSGCLLLDGGQSIRNTTDASSSTNGGSFTTLGGVSIAKKTFTGDSVAIEPIADKRNKIVLSRSDNDLSQRHEFTGFGNSSGSLYYQVTNTSSNHVFYSGTSSTTSDIVFEIRGNRDVVFSGKNGSYAVKGGGLTDSSLSFQSLSDSSNINFFTNDGLTSTTNEVCIFSSGLPDDVTNGSYMNIGWNSSEYIISSNKTGSGNLYDIVLQSGVTNQMSIKTDGSIIFGSTIVSSSSTSGSVILQSGGFSVNCTQNVTNISNGGAVTIAGGVSIAKDTYVGGTFVLGTGTHIHVDSIVTETTRSSFIITSSDSNYPSVLLQGDTSVNTSKYPVEIKLYNLGDQDNINNEGLNISTNQDLSGYTLKTFSNGTGEATSLTLHTYDNYTQFVLQTSGNVGVNTANPEYGLDINSTLRTVDRVLFTSSVNSVNSTTGCLVTEGGISISTTKEAESLTRGGALTVAGGAAIQKNLVVGGLTEFLDETPSTSLLEASVVVNGGLSIKSGENAVGVLNGGGLTVAGGGAFSGDLYVGGSINGSGSSSSTYAYLTLTATDDAVNLSTGSLITLGGITLQSDSNSINISNGGSILTPGGASIGKDVYIGGNIHLTRGVTHYYTEDDNVINFYDSFNIKRFSIDRWSSSQTFSVSRYDSLGNSIERSLEIMNSDGSCKFNNIIPSSNSDTASVVFSGGVSISKTSNATSLNNGGSLTIGGGVSVAKKMFIGGDVVMSSTTSSDDVSSGALLISGGVGISGNINVLGNALVVGNLTVRGQTTTVDTTNTSLKDNVFLLNSGPTGSSDSGFIVQRYQQDNNIGSGDVVAETYPSQTFELPGQTGMTTTQIKLTTGANAINDYYTGWWLRISSGFSNNQVRKITAYDGTTKIATLSSAWLNQNPSLGDVVQLYNKPYIGIVYNETNDRFEFGSTVQSPNQSSVLFTDQIPIHFSSATSTSTDVSTSVSTGSFKLSGGVSIANTQDASSYTSGGTITTLGGASVGKSLYVGTNLYVNGTDMTPSPYDMFSIRSFNASNNQTTFANITNLQFDSLVTGFDCYLSAKLTATTNLYVNFHIRGVNKNSNWEIVKTYVGDDTGIEFHITDFGQIQYTTPNYSGYTSLTFKWRALVT
jgi:hypothetical protein